MMCRCPYCNESYFSPSITAVTSVYYPPVYKDGVNVNPNRNISTTTCHCLNCDKEFYIHGNAVDGYEATK